MRVDLYPRLLGDVGGTHARFAWQADAASDPGDVAVERCADHATLAAAIQHYLQAHGRPAPRACAIGIANPVIGDAVRMTNHHWSFSIDALRRELGVERLLVLNDFQALALALPTLPSQCLRQVGGGAAQAGAACALIGPGTGLGVSGWVPHGGSGVALTGEGGHVTLAATDDREAAVIAFLRTRFGHVSAERVLSGPGLLNLCHALCAIDGRPCGPLSPSDVIAQGRADAGSIAGAALQLFCGFLGNAAGNLALTLGATGGVYLGGGIVPRLGDAFDAARFRQRFEAKGRFADYLAAIPCFVIVADVSPALAGASRALDLADA